MEFWMLYLDALVPWFHHSRMGGLDIENITWKDTVLWAHGSTITGDLAPWVLGIFLGRSLHREPSQGPWGPGILDLGCISWKNTNTLVPGSTTVGTLAWTLGTFLVRGPGPWLHN